MYKPSATLIVSKAIVCAASVPLLGTFIAETTNSVSLPVDTLCNFPYVRNIKALTNHKYDYRLRVGRYRVLFNHFEKIHIISIEEVKKRDDSTY